MTMRKRTNNKRECTSPTNSPACKCARVESCAEEVPQTNAAAPNFDVAPRTPVQQIMATRLRLPPSATGGKGGSSSSSIPVVRPLCFIPASEHTTKIGKPHPHQPISSLPRFSIGDSLANGSIARSPTPVTTSQRESVRAAPSPTRCIGANGRGRVDMGTQTFATDYESEYGQPQSDGYDNPGENGNVTAVEVVDLFADEGEKHSGIATEVIDVC